MNNVDYTDFWWPVHMGTVKQASKDLVRATKPRSASLRAYLASSALGHVEDALMRLEGLKSTLKRRAMMNFFHLTASDIAEAQKSGLTPGKFYFVNTEIDGKAKHYVPTDFAGTWIEPMPIDDVIFVPADPPLAAEGSDEPDWDNIAQEQTDLEAWGNAPTPYDP